MFRLHVLILLQLTHDQEQHLLLETALLQQEVVIQLHRVVIPQQEFQTEVRILIVQVLLPEAAIQQVRLPELFVVQEILRPTVVHVVAIRLHEVAVLQHTALLQVLIQVHPAHILQVVVALHQAAIPVEEVAPVEEDQVVVRVQAVQAAAVNKISSF